MDHITVAVDGPAGAGKSTIAKRIAKELGIIYLDTGAMYRTVALKAIQRGIDTRDDVNLPALVKDIDIKVQYMDGEQRIFLDGKDVSRDIRTNEISMGASNVGVIPEVRIKLVELQRKIADVQSVVMDGRDIGTYVLPNAKIKIFLTASAKKRAERRYLEMQEKGETTLRLEEVLEDIEKRDHNDSTREFAPLKKADDAVEIDSTNMSIEEVIDKVKNIMKGGLV